MSENTQHYPLPSPSAGAQINVGTVERGLSIASGLLLTATGLRRGGLTGFLRAGTGAVMLYRGLSGHCEIKARLGANPTGDMPEPVSVALDMRVAQPRADVYSVWRHLQNLPRFMHHLESVHPIDHKRSKWTAKGPVGMGRISWEAEIVEEVHGERIAWVSVPGASVSNAGQVEFMDAPDGGTDIRAHIAYRPPAGYMGTYLGRWLNPALAALLKRDLEAFRSSMEAGELEPMPLPA